MLVSGSHSGDGADDESRSSSKGAKPASAKKHAIWEFESPVRFLSWRDVNIESLGYDPRSSYVEKFWLPFLGPSTVLLARRITESLESEPYGFTVDLEEMSIMMGLGGATNRHSSIQKTLNRLLVFELARIMPSKAVSVRLKLPPLPQRYINRLPEHIQELHAKEIQEAPETSLTAVRTRARSLALTLLKLGHDKTAIEKQLISWRFHPSVCYETLSWLEQASPHRSTEDTTDTQQEEVSTKGLQP